MNEFEIIEHFFKQAYPSSQDDLILGIGDDAAIINVPEDSELLISTDTVVSGVHFFEDAAAEDIAYKSLAVNLSDMAAMGALPRWVTLSLTLPNNDLDWLKAFSTSFNTLASEYSLNLIGGDLSKGPLSITIQIHGINPKGKSLKRSGANKGDLIYVTGELGAAAYSLKFLNNEKGFNKPKQKELDQFNRPLARVRTGIELRNYASSCIDISDGLLADLGHILKASKVGAELSIDDIPFSESLLKLDQEQAYELALTGGDDYELCFTLPASTGESFIDELNQLCPVTCIGKIEDEKTGIELKRKNGSLYKIKSKAYSHF